MRGERNRTLAGGPGHRVQQPHRRRAAVLGIRTEHTGRIVVARRRGERHRHAGQPREAAGALEHPHAAAVRLDAARARIRRAAPPRLPSGRAGRAGARGRRAPRTARRSVRPQRSLGASGSGSRSASPGRWLRTTMAPAPPLHRATPSWMSTARGIASSAVLAAANAVEVHGRGEAAFGREAQRAALGMPRRVRARRPVRGIGEQPEAQPVGIHQQTSGATGTATASASANGLGSARRSPGAPSPGAPSTTSTESSSGSCQSSSVSDCVGIGGVARQQAPLGPCSPSARRNRLMPPTSRTPGHARDLHLDLALAHVAAERPAAAVDAARRQRPQQPLQRLAHGEERRVAVVAFANRDGRREAERHVLAADHVELGGERRPRRKVRVQALDERPIRARVRRARQRLGGQRHHRDHARARRSADRAA